MSRRKQGSFPSLRHHKASGLAVVTLSGQDFYCGNFGTKASLAEYDRLIAEWLARGRRSAAALTNDDEITVVELIAAYKRFAEGYYRKKGKVTNEVTAILSAARFVKSLYGRESANSFGPLKLQAIQQAMIQAGWCRKNINKQIGRIVRMFGWGVSQELVKADVAHALREVKGLHKGRTQAVDRAPVMPIEDSLINVTLDHLPPIVGDMVRFQRLTGCRPEEVCVIRPCDLDTTGPVWAYRPQSHKTEHHGRERVIFVGPKGQDVLRSYLLRDKNSFCFCPAEGEQKRRAAVRSQRVTPAGYGNRPGTNRQSMPRRKAGQHYSTDSYRRAITRACEAAGIASWAPNRIRHSAATEIRKRFGLEAAQVALGHAAADVTQIYAERDQEKAAAVMLQVG